MDDYLITYNGLGEPWAINKLENGAALPFDPVNKTFDETNPLVVELRAWEAANELLDLTPKQPQTDSRIIYRLNSLIPADRNISPFRFPEDINYNTELVFGLSVQTLEYFGLRIGQIFEQTLDSQTLEPLENPIPIVFERYKYVWDNKKFPISRIKEIKFYTSRGELSEQTKYLPKYFKHASDRSFINYSRRKTIVNWLVARSVELGLEEQLNNFFDEYQRECDRYIRHGRTNIINLVLESTESWLDTDTTTEMGSIRQAIVLSFQKALSVITDEEVDSYLASLELFNAPANS